MVPACMPDFTSISLFSDLAHAALYAECRVTRRHRSERGVALDDVIRAMARVRIRELRSRSGVEQLASRGRTWHERLWFRGLELRQGMNVQRSSHSMLWHNLLKR